MADYGAIGKTYQLGYNRVLGGAATLPNYRGVNLREHQLVYNRVLGGAATLPNYRGVNLREYSSLNNSTVQGIKSRSELARYIKSKYIAGFRVHK
jgi:hypothetical protein